MPTGHDADVVFGIGGDNTNLEQALKQATQSIETESRKWTETGNNAVSGLSNAFSGLFGKLAAGFSAAAIGKAVVDLGKKAVEAATELQEVQKSIDATFGHSSSLESWADKAAENFGLTEAKAKSAAQSIGSLLKAGGIVGDQLVDMSTRLTGLASDLADFYGTDFESAFQRIKAGINGQTEPLKQFGINLSKANLEAFALSKGVTKTFEQMSAAEQTMLRYEYILQETAQAQGAFADSADDYTSGLAKLQAGLDNLAANLGKYLIPMLNEAVGFLNTMFEKLAPKQQRTVLDDFAEIDLDTKGKIDKIEETANKANDLISVLQEIANAEVKENPGLTGFVDALQSKLGDLDGAMEAAKTGDYAGTIGAISNAMTLKLGADPTRWSNLFTAIAENLGDVSDLTSKDTTTANFLDKAAEAANKLGGEYPGLWDSFMKAMGSSAATAALIHLSLAKSAADALGTLGLNANSLQWGTGTKWAALMSTLNTIEPTKGLFGSDAATAAGNIKSIADGLSSNDPAKQKDAWDTMLGILSNNADGLATLTGKTPEETKKWLDELALSAQNIDPEDANAWSTLFGALLEGLPNLANYALGETFLNSLSTMSDNTNKLYLWTPGNWKSLLDTLSTANTTSGIFGDGVVGKINDFVGALSSEVPAERKQAWTELLGIFAEHKQDIANFTGQSVEDVEAWLKELNDATPQVGDNVKEWDNLFTALIGHLTSVTSMNPIDQNFLDNMDKVATGSNKLDAGSGNNWTLLLNALNTADVTSGIFGTDAGTKISSMVQALTSTDPNTKREAWADILGVLSDNADGVAKLTGKPVEEVKKWFEDLSAAVPETDEDLGAWDELFTSLVEGLANLEGKTGLSAEFLTNLESVKKTGNGLNYSSGVYWTRFLEALQKTDGLTNIFGSNANQAATNIGSLAQALSSSDVGEKAEGWKTLLSALSDHAAALTTLTGDSVENTKQWLHDLAEGANELNPEDADGWKTLFDQLRQGLPGLKFEEGQDGGIAQFIALLSEGFSLLEWTSVDAEQALSALGYNSTLVSDKHELWLRTCKELVTTIPGLSTLINAETGEIKGGIGVIKTFVDEWKESQEAMVRWKAYYSRQAALEERRKDEYGYDLDVLSAKNKLKRLQEEYEALGGDKAFNSYWELSISADDIRYNAKETKWGGLIANPSEEAKKIKSVSEQITAAQLELINAEHRLTKEQEANADAVQAQIDLHDALIDEYGDEAAAAGKAAYETEQAGAAVAAADEAARQAMQNSVNAAGQALKAVSDYYDQVANTIESTLNRVAGGFAMVVTPAEKAKKELQSLEKELAEEEAKKGKKDENGKETYDAKHANELRKKVSDKKAELPTVQTMSDALESQEKFFDEYTSALETVSNYTGTNGRKVSDSMIAMLADGSAESLDYLKALQEAMEKGDTKKVDELLDKWDKVQEKKDSLKEYLTDTQLSVDDAFQSLVDAASKAIQNLDLEENATTAMENTVQGIANGIQNKYGAVQSAVNSICEELDRLNQYGRFGFNGSTLTFTGLNRSGSTRTLPQRNESFVPHANGLDYVPFDGYLSELHRGEAVLREEEAAVWRNYRAGMDERSGLDYDSLGAVISANSKGGGNVYLDGERVGRVMSAAQADSYRRMERSGFQA